MTCNHCGHEQREGEICESCGMKLRKENERGDQNMEKERPNQEESELSSAEEVASLEAETELLANEEEAEQAEDLLTEVEEAQEEAASSDSMENIEETGDAAENDAVEKVKEASNAYFTYFMNFLKQPNHEEVKETDWVNGIINIVLAVLIFSFAHQKYMSDMLSFGIFGSESLGFKYWANAFFFVLVAMGIAYLLIFAVKKFFSTKEISFLKLLAIYGAYMTPVLPLSLVALLIALVGIDKLSIFLVYFTLFAMILLVPLYIITHILLNYSKGVEPFYAYLIYIVGFFLGVAIVDAILLDSIIPFAPVSIPDFGFNFQDLF